MKSNPRTLTAPVSLIITDEPAYFEGALLVPGGNIETSCYTGSGSVLLSLPCAVAVRCSEHLAVPRGNFSCRLTPDQARALAKHLVKAAKMAGKGLVAA